MKKNYLIAGGLILLAVIFGVYVSYNSYQSNKTSLPAGALDGFVQCIKDKGVVFYGAFWCPHCQATKKLFGDSESKLPYVECSTPNGQGQTQACIDKQINEYPTWVTADGTRITGEHTLPELAADFSCPLPESVTGASTTPVSPAAASSAKR